MTHLRDSNKHIIEEIVRQIGYLPGLMTKFGNNVACCRVLQQNPQHAIGIFLAYSFI
jgi:hypothetical protein